MNEYLANKYPASWKLDLPKYVKRPSHPCKVCGDPVYSALEMCANCYSDLDYADLRETQERARNVGLQ